MLPTYFLHVNAEHVDLLSFPTRRSSDLQMTAQSATNQDEKLLWHVAHTRPRCEKKLADYCEREGVHVTRSEEHTSELQSLTNLVCRLLLEKKHTEEGASARSARGKRHER